MSSAYPIGQGTLAVNDQLIPAPLASFFAPRNVTGPVFQGQPQGLQTIPVGVGATLGAASASAGAGAAANPWSPTKAPLVAMIGMLVAGLLILRYVHWRG